MGRAPLLVLVLLWGCAASGSPTPSQGGSAGLTAGAADGGAAGGSGAADGGSASLGGDGASGAAGSEEGGSSGAPAAGTGGDLGNDSGGAGSPTYRCDYISECKNVAEDCGAALSAPCQNCRYGSYSCGTKVGFHTDDGKVFPCAADCAAAAAAARRHCGC